MNLAVPMPLRGLGECSCSSRFQQLCPHSTFPLRVSGTKTTPNRASLCIEAASSAGIGPCRSGLHDCKLRSPHTHGSTSRGRLRATQRGGSDLQPATSIPVVERDSVLLDAAPPYTLEQTRALVDTAMLAAVSGLAYVLATLLKLENSIGYFLPLPIILASMRSGIASGWRTMMATSFLLVVLLGPLRALSYLCLHGALAGTLGTFWCLRASWWLSVGVGAFVRMGGQLSYLVLTSVTMNENLFAILLSNVYSMLDQITAALGSSGAPSLTTVICSIFALLLVNGVCYVFLLHIVYRILLQAMGFAAKLGPMPGILKRFLYPSGIDPTEAALAAAAASTAGLGTQGRSSGRTAR